MPPNARLSWHIRLTLTCYSHVSPVNIFGSPPFRLRQTVCLSGSEAEGGVGVRACLHRSCTPRVGNLYSVKRTPDGPGVRATEYKSLVAHKVWLDSDQLSSTVPSPADSVPVWFRGRGEGVGASVCIHRPCTPRGSWGNPMAGRCFNVLFLAGIVFTAFVV